MSIFTTIISSLVATAATAPFAIYHFSRNSPYGILANILAIPMTSFEIMPLGVLAIVLMPLDLDWLVSEPLRFGINFIVWVANYFAKLPYANSTIPAITAWQLLLLSLGFLWLALWKTRLRLLGIIFILVAVIGSFFNKSPDLIISNDGALFAVKDENGDLLFSSARGSNYIKNVWSARAGQENIPTIDNAGSKIIACDTAGCIYRKNGYKTAIIKHPIILETECKGSQIFINLTGINYDCEDSIEQISLYNLKKKGAHEFYLGGGITVKTVDTGKERIWER